MQYWLVCLQSFLEIHVSHEILLLELVYMLIPAGYPTSTLKMLTCDGKDVIVRCHLKFLIASSPYVVSFISVPPFPDVSESFLVESFYDVYSYFGLFFLGLLGNFGLLKD